MLDREKVRELLALDNLLESLKSAALIMGVGKTVVTCRKLTRICRLSCRFCKTAMIVSLEN